MGDREFKRAFDAGFQAGYAVGLRDGRQSTAVSPGMVPPPAGSAAPAARPPAPPPPSPAELAERRRRASDRNLNALLYLSSFFLIGAAAALLAGSLPSTTKLLGVWTLIGLFFGAGLLLVRRVARLRTAGLAFTWTGLAILPFGGVALAGYTQMSGELAWMITSLLGLAALAASLIVIRQPVMGYLSVLMVISLTVSATAVLPVPQTWMLVALVVSGLGATLARRMLPRRNAVALLHRPSWITTWVASPLAILIAWATVPPRDQVAVAVAGAVQYAVAWLLEVSWKRFTGLRVLLLVALVNGYWAFPTGRYGGVAVAVTGSALAALSTWFLTRPRLAAAPSTTKGRSDTEPTSPESAETAPATEEPSPEQAPAVGYPARATPADAADLTPDAEQPDSSAPTVGYPPTPPGATPDTSATPTVGYPPAPADTPAGLSGAGAPAGAATVRTSYGMVPAALLSDPERAPGDRSPSPAGSVATDRTLEQVLLGLGLATTASGWLWPDLPATSWFSVVIGLLLTVTAAGSSLILRSFPLAVVAGFASFLIPVTSPFTTWDTVIPWPSAYDVTSHTVIGALVTALAVRVPPRQPSWKGLAAVVGCGHLLLGSLLGSLSAYSTPTGHLFRAGVAMFGLTVIATTTRLRPLRVLVVAPSAIAFGILLSESGTPNAWQQVVVPVVALLALVAWLVIDFRRPRGPSLTLTLTVATCLASGWLADTLVWGYSIGPATTGVIGLLVALAGTGLLWLWSGRRVYLVALAWLSAWTVLASVLQDNAYLTLPALALITAICWFVALTTTKALPTGIGAGTGAALQVLAALVCWFSWPIHDLTVAVGYIHAAAGILAAATLWWRRHAVPMLPAVLAMPTALLAIAAADGQYITLFLAEQVAIVVLGTWLERRWAVLWGLVTSTIAILAFVRGDRFIQLILLAATMIGIVVWRLLRQNPRPRPSSPLPAGRASAPGAKTSTRRPVPPLEHPARPAFDAPATGQPGPARQPEPPVLPPQPDAAAKPGSPPSADPGPQPAVPEGPHPPDTSPAAGTPPHRPDYLAHGPRSHSNRAQGLGPRHRSPDADRH